MGSGWIDAGEVTSLLQRQVAGICGYLGHRMGSWEADAREQGNLVCKCTSCGDVARVSVRHFRTAPLSGPAVALRCRGRRDARAAAGVPAPATRR